MHAVTLDHGCRRFVDVYGTIDSPPSVTLRSLDDGVLLRVIYDRRDPRIDALGLQPPELVTLHNRAGVPLHGALV